MPEISIIVPVYNTEQYLNRCIKSILKQTFTDFELILVDDGSTDKCPLLCEEWKTRDKRIHVIHKENGGLSSARNSGLNAANGNYIGFVDSDDWIAPDMYEVLYRLITNNKADYAGSEMVIAKSESIVLSQPQYREILCTQDELFNIFFRVSDKNIHYCVCDKLYKKSILKNLYFWEGMRFEDIDFNFKVIQQCTTGVYTNQIKYFWFYNEDSITRNVLVPEDMQLLEIWENIVNDCRERMPQHQYYAKMNYARAYLGLLGKSTKFGVSDRYINWEKERKNLIKQLRKYFLDLLFWNMPLSRKLLLCALCVSPKFTSILFHRKK